MHLTTSGLWSARVPQQTWNQTPVTYYELSSLFFGSEFPSEIVLLEILTVQTCAYIRPFTDSCHRTWRHHGARESRRHAPHYELRVQITGPLRAETV
jgi:hypothetical protein